MEGSVFLKSHPLLNFIYFSGAIVTSMFFFHPVFLSLSIGIALSYALWLTGPKTLKFLLYMTPLLIGAVIINPLFNHEGVTILFYLKNGNPITLESILYGVFTGAMVLAVMLWFRCYHVIMTSDKFMYLFGSMVPTLSLVFSMILRLVPRLTHRFSLIKSAQHSLGRHVQGKSILKRIRHSLTLFSILTTWSLENSIETANSMKGRGYGLKGRTHFSNYTLNAREVIEIVFLILLLVIIGVGFLYGETNMTFFPQWELKQITVSSYILYGVYVLFLLTPFLLSLEEILRWHKLK